MIKLINITKYYEERAVLDSIHYHFPEGKKIILVGANGAGKTTLFKLLSGLETPDSGEITGPKDLKVGHLPQEPNPNPKPTVLEEVESAAQELYNLRLHVESLAAKLDSDHSEKTLNQYVSSEEKFSKLGGYELSSLAFKLLSGLGVPDTYYDVDPRTLSGGYRMRVEFARLFISKPHILLLDEPTNHLDLPSLCWVENFLKNYDGTVILISHDRDLLNRMADITLHIERGRLKAYVGNYDYFLKEKNLQDAQAEKTFANIESRKAQLQDFVDRFGAKASKAAQANSKRKLIDRMSEEQQTLDRKVEVRTLQFQLPQPKACDRILYRAEKLAIGYKTPLFEKLDLSFEKGHRLAVIGANGLGKSTFLKVLCGQLTPLQGELKVSPRTDIGYFAQDQHDVFEHDMDLMNNIMKKTEISEAESRKLLGQFMFSGNDAFKLFKVLSGGEKTRLGLASLLAKKHNLLLLDEPTNHLDMDSVDMLVKALQSYAGSMVVVSHNRNFINAVCSHVLVFAGPKKWQIFSGNLDDYKRHAAKIGFPNILEG